MKPFEGCKFRNTHDLEYYRDYNTNELKCKEKVVATKSYIKYLELAYIESLEKEAKILKYRLDKEFKEFGECDKVDVQRYVGLIQDIHSRQQRLKINPKNKEGVAKSGKLQPMKYAKAPEPYLPKPSYK